MIRFDQALPFFKASSQIAFRDRARNIEWTYAQWISEIERALPFFKEINSSRNPERKPVLLYYGNEVETFISFFAHLALGIPVGLLNPASCQLRFDSIVEDSGAALIFSNSRTDKNRTRHGHRFIDFVWSPETTGPTQTAPPPALGATLLEEDQPALILFTSGSTGRAKGVAYGLKNLLFAANNIIKSCELKPASQELLLCSVSHSDGWQRAMATLFHGGTIHLVPYQESAQKMVEWFDGTVIDSFFLPTPLIPLLQRLPARTLAALDERTPSIEMGTTPITEKDFAKLLQILPQGQFYYHYGLTEASRACTLNLRRDKDLWSTVGRANEGYRLHLEQGQVAIECAARPRRFLIEGQWVNDSSPTFKTRDLGEVDAHGFLKLYGRVDEMMDVGGNHFYPMEVKKLILRYDFVRDCEVFPGSIDIPYIGRAPEIHVVLDGDAEKVAQNKKAVQDALPHFLKPFVKTVPAIARTESGKPLRVTS